MLIEEPPPEDAFNGDRSVDWTSLAIILPVLLVCLVLIGILVALP